MIKIELFDGTVLEFPEGTSPDVIDRVAKQETMARREAAPAPRGPDGMTTAERVAAAKAGTLAPPSADRLADVARSDEKAALNMRSTGDVMLEALMPGELARSGAAGVARGVALLAGLPGTLGDGMDWAAKKAGILRENAPGNQFSGKELVGKLSDLTGGATDYVGPGFLNKAMGTAGEFVGGGAGGKAGLAAGFASEGAGYLTEGTAIEPYARAAAGFAGGLLTNVLSNAVTSARTKSKYIKDAPAGESLKADAAALYKKADARGVVSPPDQTTILRDQMLDIAKKEGFITPKGNATASSPELRAVLRSYDDYLDAPVTVQDLQAIRGQLQLVAESAVPKVSRLGAKLLKAHDAFTAKLAPELKEANALYTRAMRGEMMDRVDDLADIRASQFTGSGRENALRTEFRALDRQVAKGQLKGLRPDQAAAIKDVSRGTKASNFATTVGKAAPTGVVSAGLSGGVPYMIGNSIAGPVAGATAAATSMGVGLLGRAMATRLQEGAAAYASAAMRAGVPMEQISARIRDGLLGLATVSAAKTQQE